MALRDSATTFGVSVLTEVSTGAAAVAVSIVASSLGSPDTFVTVPQSPWFWRLGFAGALAGLALAAIYLVYMASGDINTFTVLGAIFWTVFSIIWFIASSRALSLARQQQQTTDT